eukprot:CAMPEP_0174381064 /NCGR_PEP_ID=MMETSP0811_2-20130205/123774_1 /TAXON_ID=73025 ORGANISM="Eutreptiella gymnastica-like, Strain CCMP1594" /NCGR_SAMPLE_ID=MMETSP0811_2 /ASSEMBLY_ACC=CAM_ASM_000667 /LENGTH=95 /DNA_ID=CAMNT_0015534107 /DNA_START=137 /DNA_END=424 /DNA_ORIENTATION=+
MFAPAAGPPRASAWLQVLWCSTGTRSCLTAIEPAPSLSFGARGSWESPIAPYSSDSVTILLRSVLPPRPCGTTSAASLSLPPQPIIPSIYHRGQT